MLPSLGTGTGMGLASQTLHGAAQSCGTTDRTLGGINPPLGLFCTASGDLLHHPRAEVHLQLRNQVLEGEHHLFSLQPCRGPSKRRRSSSEAFPRWNGMELRTRHPLAGPPGTGIVMEGLSISILFPLDLTELEDSSTELLSSAALFGKCPEDWEAGRGWQGLALESAAAGTDVQPWQLVIPWSQTTQGPFQQESLKKAWY